MSGRRARVEQALRDALAEMIDREIKDPRVRGAGLVTVQRVELTADLSVARVYVSVFGGEAVGRRAVAGLAAAAGFLRGPLGRRLNLQKPPELRFVHDQSPEMAQRLANVIREDEAKAAVAGGAVGVAFVDDDGEEETGAAEQGETGTGTVSQEETDGGGEGT